MSSLNINDLYEKINSKNMKRFEIFDNILQKIHVRIRYNASLERTYCFYSIPEFVIGTPLYNVNDLKNYLINSLTRNGFNLLYIDPNWLFITWELDPKKIIQKKLKERVKKQGDFKLIDEYKPSGNFIYNEQDLLSMEKKMKSFI